MACFCLLSDQRRQGRFHRYVVCSKNAQMVKATSDVTTSCLWLLSECVTSWCLKNIWFIYFELSGTCAHVAQRRGLMPPETLLAAGDVSFSQMAGSCFLLVGRRKEFHFHTGAKFRRSIHLWLTATNRDVSQEHTHTMVTLNGGHFSPLPDWGVLMSYWLTPLLFLASR